MVIVEPTGGGWEGFTCVLWVVLYAACNATLVYIYIYGLCMRSTAG